MREGSGGMTYIDGLMEKFAAKHALHISLYGADNHKRLTGVHETSSIHKFSYGTGNRAASFRIPTQVMHDNGKGYVEAKNLSINDTCIKDDMVEIMIKEIKNHEKETVVYNLLSVTENHNFFANKILVHNK